VFGTPLAATFVGAALPEDEPALTVLVAEVSFLAAALSALADASEDVSFFSETTSSAIVSSEATSSAVEAANVSSSWPCESSTTATLAVDELAELAGLPDPLLLAAEACLDG
jgi:hypothetical protein